MQPWLPTLYTQSLSGTEDFPSDGDRLIRVVERYWQEPEVTGKFKLDDWQRWLIRHVLETYPQGHPQAGQLRYRQVVVSMGRQNGKSTLGGIFGLYGLLLHEKGPQVIGVASNREQANIVFAKVLYNIRNNPPLSKLARPTETRGITRRDGSGSYKCYPSKSASLQGIPISMCLFDELHISIEEMWQAVVNGQRTRKNGLILGITTAGDEQSHLLKSLYETGKQAANGEKGLERTGFFLWEAPEGATIDDDEAILSANPSIASGRIDLDTVKSDVRNLPEPDQQRYVLNRFVASTSTWLPMSAWHKCAGEGVPQQYANLVFAIDRSPDWGFATITATTKDAATGTLHTEVVARIIKPNLDQLLRLAMALRQHGQCTFVMDGYVLPELAKELRQRGLSVMTLTLKEIMAACSTAYAKIVQGKVSHPNEDLLRQQMPRAKRKNMGEGWRISRADSSVEIDGVMATIQGLWVADTQRTDSMQLF